jgi:hypothetical protein
MKELGKGFFFEKKKQQTFVNLGHWLFNSPSCPGRAQRALAGRPQRAFARRAQRAFARRRLSKTWLAGLSPRPSQHHETEDQKFFGSFFQKRTAAFLKTATP